MLNPSHPNIQNNNTPPPVLLVTLLRVADWRLALLEYPTLLDDSAVKGLFELHVRACLYECMCLFCSRFVLCMYMHVRTPSFPIFACTSTPPFPPTTPPTKTTALQPRRDRRRRRRRLPGQSGARRAAVPRGGAGVSREVRTIVLCVGSCGCIGARRTGPTALLPTRAPTNPFPPNTHTQTHTTASGQTPTSGGGGPRRSSHGKGSSCSPPPAAAAAAATTP